MIRRIDMVSEPYPLGYTPSMVFTQPPVEAALRVALPEPGELSRFVTALDRVATVVLGDTTDPARFCRACDVEACLGSERECPSVAACRVNAPQT